MTTFSNSNITNSSYDSSSKVSSFNNSSSNTFNYNSSSNNNFNSNLTRQLLAASVEERSLKSLGCEIPPLTGLY